MVQVANAYSSQFVVGSNIYKTVSTTNFTVSGGGSNIKMLLVVNDVTLICTLKDVQESVSFTANNCAVNITLNTVTAGDKSDTLSPISGCVYYGAGIIRWSTVGSYYLGYRTNNAGGTYGPILTFYNGVVVGGPFMCFGIYFSANTTLDDFIDYIRKNKPSSGVTFYNLKSIITGIGFTADCYAYRTSTIAYISMFSFSQNLNPSPTLFPNSAVNDIPVYNILVEEREITYSASNGTISGSSSAAYGDTVTLTITPDTGYKLSSLAVYKTASQDPVNYIKVNDTTYTFVMPDANVTVTGIFVKVYTVTGTAFPNNAGSVIVTSPHRANENVSFTVVPNEGYFIDSILVYGLNNSLEFEWNEETSQGSFSMPSRNVNVVAYLSNRLDPNEQGGISQPAGGGGSFNITSDLIPVPAVIGNGILQDTVSKGLITAYNPSAATVADVGNWLYATDWGDALYQGFRDLFVKPIDSLVSLMILPVVPHSSTNGKITFGPHNTNLSAPVIDQQYVDKDLGYLEIKEYWGSYLDYNPFTKIQLFLPFIGSVDLDTDLVMGKTIKIKYRIDILTGACVAFLATYENNSESVFSEFTGHCGMQIPISATDSSSIASALMTTSALVLTKGASAIASDQSAALKVTQATNRSQLATYAVAKGNVSKEAIKERHDAAKALEEAKAFEKGVNSKNAQALEYPVTYTVGHVMGSKVTSTISGSVSGGPGLMGSNKPFLIIRRPRQSLAEEYKHYVGYPCNMTCKLGTLSGFTRVEQVWLENVPCTDEEIADIITSLKEGVVI